ncbi:MAG: hypothetical protein KDI48_10685 [Xanthomonadales bacterium]|nr:hypothetical protein [Xanthomonadales bacterium]
MNRQEELELLGVSADLLGCLNSATAGSVRLSLLQLPAPAAGRWSLRWFGQSVNWRVALIQEVQPRQRGRVWLCLHDRVGSPFAESDWCRWLDGPEAAGAMVPWPYGALDPRAQISAHFLGDVRQLNSIRDGQMRLLEGLRALSEAEELLVCGHGRAGALASVLTPWLDTQMARRGRLRSRVHSFGAPTAGDWVFARGLESAYGLGQGRCLSRHDPMPYCWGGLRWLGRAGGRTPPPALLRDRFEVLTGELAGVGPQFCQPPGGCVLDALQPALAADCPTAGTIESPTGSGWSAASDWYVQAAHAHALGTYQRRLQRLLQPAQRPQPAAYARAM